MMRPNCIVTLSREALQQLLGVKIIGMRISPDDMWPY